MVSGDQTPVGHAGKAAGEFLRNVYDLSTQADTDEYYTEWAATYSAELTQQGYRTPGRCAEALRQFVALDAPVLDIGLDIGPSME